MAWAQKDGGNLGYELSRSAAFVESPVLTLAPDGTARASLQLHCIARKVNACTYAITVERYHTVFPRVACKNTIRQLK